MEQAPRPYQASNDAPHELISRASVDEALALKKLGLLSMAPRIHRLVGIERVNTFYQEIQGLPADQFVDAIFKKMNVKVEIPADAHQHFPQEGPFWLISNHPLGLWDGLVMMKMMMTVRKEFKIITLFFLERVHELRPHIIPVNNWHDKKDLGSNTASMRDILKHFVRDKTPIGLFPGGSVSRFIWRFGRITDPVWNPTAIKLIQKLPAPVVPMYIRGRNSFSFYLISLFSPMLRRTRNLPEFFNKRGRTIRVAVGPAIQPSDYQHLTTPEALSQFLRTKVYDLKGQK